MKAFRDKDIRFKIFAFVVAVIIGWIIYSGYVRQEQIDALAAGLADEQAATRARGDTPVAPDPSEILKDPSLRGAEGRGIADTETEGCYVRVILTDDSSNRVGPFCGDPGSPGPSGKPGKTGAPGATGQPGTSITGVTTEGCYIVISLSSGDSVRAGPFCGPKGDTGEAGKPGRSIVDSTCVLRDDEVYRWRIEYDNDGDGDVDEVDEDAGPCNGSDKPPLVPTP